MKIKYECDHCKVQFNSEQDCRIHEILHLQGLEELKYYAQYATDINLCNYCDNVYYVYGCELNCEYKDCGPKNNYKHFKGENLDDFKRNICKGNDKT